MDADGVRLNEHEIRDNKYDRNLSKSGRSVGRKALGKLKETEERQKELEVKYKALKKEKEEVEANIYKEWKDKENLDLPKYLKENPNDLTYEEFREIRDKEWTEESYRCTMVEQAPEEIGEDTKWGRKVKEKFSILFESLKEKCDGGEFSQLKQISMYKTPIDSEKRIKNITAFFTENDIEKREENTYLMLKKI
ncbi:hypothetical protein FQA39_LY01070 [Lamprigera yunnana]|nr:hypothetical protein FQA39_LY01070 [Lamprigera yunnana]